MVTRKRLRLVLGTLGLYSLAAVLISFFAVNAYSGKHGLHARQALEQQKVELSGELRRLRRERRIWERRVGLLRANKLDPDMLDERARTLLNYAGPNDLTLLIAPGD